MFNKKPHTDCASTQYLQPQPLGDKLEVWLCSRPYFTA